MARGTVVAVLLGVLGLGSARSFGQTFTDITSQAGLDKLRAMRPAGWWVSGLHFVDLDGDGSLDFFMSGHDMNGALAALNDGKGRFTAAPGVYPSTEIHLAYDADGDGRLDLSMTYVDGGGRWHRNESSPGLLKFTPTSVTRDGNTARQQTLSDVNRDGRVDWVRGTQAGAGSGAVVFDLGDGAGGFSRGQPAVTGTGTNPATFMFDMDGDGDVDFVTSWGASYDGPTAYARVYAQDSGRFTDVTAAAGLPGNLLILGAADVDHNGTTDLIGLENATFPHVILLNDGRGRFTRRPGAITGAPAGRPRYGGWGLASLADLDNDGIGDLLVNGRYYLHILRGTGGGSFVYANQTWGGIPNLAEASVDGGYAFGDIDRDGDLDLACFRALDPNRQFVLYRNDLPRRSWINVRPIGLPGHRGAPGARIYLREPGTRKLLWYEEVMIHAKQVQQNGYAFAETERHYGLGSRSAVDVEVVFYPSGKAARAMGVPANTTVRLSEEGAVDYADAGTPAPDGGAGPDEGEGGAEGGGPIAGGPIAGGGGCSTARGGPPWLAVLGVLAIGLCRRRRRAGS
jgi:hypothetical protein